MIRGEVIDKELKESVLAKAKKIGCDTDGDLVVWEHNLYYVELWDDLVVKLEIADDQTSIDWPTELKSRVPWTLNRNW